MKAIVDAYVSQMFSPTQVQLCITRMRLILDAPRHLLQGGEDHTAMSKLVNCAASISNHIQNSSLMSAHT
jgi:alcohol dehydrogenase class IV